MLALNEKDVVVLVIDAITRLVNQSSLDISHRGPEMIAVSQNESHVVQVICTGLFVVIRVFDAKTEECLIQIEHNVFSICIAESDQLPDLCIRISELDEVNRLVVAWRAFLLELDQLAQL